MLGGQPVAPGERGEPLAGDGQPCPSSPSHQKEEELRKEEERKKALDARLRFEQERMEQERLEQEERERRYREREEQIEEHRHGGVWGRARARGCACTGWLRTCCERLGGCMGVGSRAGVGTGTGRSWCPAPLLCPRRRRKQQSMEAEEARQRLKEQSIFVSAAAGVGPGFEPKLLPGVTPKEGLFSAGSPGHPRAGRSCHVSL